MHLKRCFTTSQVTCFKFHTFQNFLRPWICGYKSKFTSHILLVTNHKKLSIQGGNQTNIMDRTLNTQWWPIHVCGRPISSLMHAFIVVTCVKFSCPWRLCRNFTIPTLLASSSCLKFCKLPAKQREITQVVILFYDLVHLPLEHHV